MSLRIEIVHNKKNGISAMCVVRGCQSLFTALASNGRVFHAWASVWENDEAREVLTTLGCANPHQSAAAFIPFTSAAERDRWLGL